MVRWYRLTAIGRSFGFGLTTIGKTWWTSTRGFLRVCVGKSSPSRRKRQRRKQETFPKFQHANNSRGHKEGTPLVPGNKRGKTFGAGIGQNKGGSRARSE